jgi:hypothetical protein
MVKELDPSVPVEEMTAILRQVFENLFPGGKKIIACKALGEMNKLFKFSKELRGYKKELRYIRRLNRKSRERAIASEGKHRAVRRTVRLGWCGLCG